MKDEDSKALLAVLGIPVFIILIFIAFVPLGLFNAWALQKMYIWFLLPLGLPALNLAQVWGISLIIRYFTENAGYEKSEKGDAWIRLFNSLLATILMLIVGLILRGLS